MTLVFVLFFSSLQLYSLHAKQKKKVSDHDYQIVTGEDPDEIGNRWDAAYLGSKEYIYGREPATFLVENLKSLPKKGQVLDLAMGEGRNAVFLAKKGFVVEGVDVSKEAIRRAKQLAHEKNVKIKTILADLRTYQIKPEFYDVIIVFYYLDRALIPAIKKGLKKGGVLLFENYTEEHLQYDKTISQEYLLKKGELEKLFADFQILKFFEGDNGKKEFIAHVMARKP